VADPVGSVLSTVTGGPDHLSDVAWAHKHFLNPQVPRALQDDPSGEFHANHHHIRDEHGRPIDNLKEGKPIPLRLRSYQQHVMGSDRKLRALRWGRRCTVEGTPVLMADGSWKSIEDVSEGEKVMSRSKEGNLEAKPVDLEWENGVKDVYEITLKNGRSITCTENHPLLQVNRDKYKGVYRRPDKPGVNEYEWTSIEDGLAEGDNTLCLGEHDSGYGDLHEPALGTILGYMLTDGYMNGENQTPKLTTTDAGMAYDFSARLLEEFGFAGSWRVNKDPHRGTKTRYDIYLTDGRKSTSNTAVEKFKALNIWGRKSDRKRLPSCVWDWDHETAFAFISSMISGDGSIHVAEQDDGRTRTQATVACSNSEEMLRQIRLLLMRMGISGTVKTQTRVTNRSDGETTIHYLEVADRDSLRLLLEGTGPVTGKEEARRECLNALDDKANSRYVRTEDGQWMHARIRSIEHKGRAETYDIGVEDNHNYIADGIVVHNTGKSFQVGVEIVTEALRNPKAKVLVLAPGQNQVKLLFDDYIRPLLQAYRHRASTKIGIDDDDGELGTKADFYVKTDTKKPQEIVLSDGDNHHASIRGMVVSENARGQSASLVVLDEADYADSDSLREIVAPITMSSAGTRILMVSTPSGKSQTFFRDAWSDTEWWTSHKTFEVLPHYNEELHNDMARLAGGEDTNTFRREYLAEWGSSTEGVFNEEALEKSYIVSPYPRVIESLDEATGERRPMIAASATNYDRGKGGKLAHYQGVRPTDYGNGEIGARSVFRPGHMTGKKGVITAGTDWNEVAGMQTVITWWPPEDMLENGDIQVSRFPYQNGTPDVTSRAKDGRGKPIPFTVGHDNGDPGGPHDLSNVKGIIIWHGRLEAGQFNWSSAANRVASIMAIDGFIDCWYVDKGYGTQVNQMIQMIMASGQWESDMYNVYKSRDIDEPVLNNIRKFDPDKDPEKTGKLYKTIRFGEKYDHRDIDFSKGEGRYKDVMVNLTRKMVNSREILFPYGAMTGRHHPDDMGSTQEATVDRENERIAQERVEVNDTDRIEENGADMARGEGNFGGLLTQMQTTYVDGYTTTGRPRYKGDWHAVDGLMLSNLAYFENFSEASEGNMFRTDGNVPSRKEEDVFHALDTAGGVSRRSGSPDGQAQNGAFSHPSYDGTGEGPLQDLMDGNVSSEEAGTTLSEMANQARKHLTGSGD
jgi:intein/homing endonuclease